MDASLSHGLERLAEKLSSIVNQFQFFENWSESEKSAAKKLISRVHRILNSCRANRLKLEELGLAAKSNGVPVKLSDEAQMCSSLLEQAEELIEATELTIRVISTLFLDSRKVSSSAHHGENVNVSVLGQRSEMLRRDKLMADAVQAQNEAGDLARTARHNATVAEFKTRLNNKKSSQATPSSEKAREEADYETVPENFEESSSQQQQWNSEKLESPIISQPANVAADQVEELIYNNNAHTHTEAYQSPPPIHQDTGRDKQVFAVSPPPVPPPPASTDRNFHQSSSSFPAMKSQKESKSCCSGTVICIFLAILLLAGGAGAAVYFFVIKK